MLSRLKKRSEAGAQPQVPAWHPNFRNYEKLPDIKVVRTAFFVNGLAVSVALALGIYVGLKEWEVRTLRQQVAAWDAQIERDKRPSDQAVALFKRFQAEEAKVLEANAFVKAKPPVSDILIRLAGTLPPHIMFDAFDLREAGLTLRLAVRGTPDAASGRATAYLEQLRADAELTRQFDQFNFVSTPTPNPGTGLMTVEFFLRAKGPKK